MKASDGGGSRYRQWERVDMGRAPRHGDAGIVVYVQNPINTYTHHSYGHLFVGIGAVI